MWVMALIILALAAAAFVLSLLPDGRDVGDHDARGRWVGTR
jgi:hypothetical protein